MSTACAIPGMLSPWREDVGDISAPVATKRTFFSIPFLMRFRIYEQSTLALQPQPEPPA